jgi:hypothetical protein
MLRVATETLKRSQAFSFRAEETWEKPAGSGEFRTYHRRYEVTLSRPNRLRIRDTGKNPVFDLYLSKGEAIVYCPESNLYAGLPARAHFDIVLDRLEARAVGLPFPPLIRIDPYRVLALGADQAPVAGPVEIDGAVYYHFALSRGEVETRLLVEGGPQPTIRRLQVAHQGLQGTLQITTDYFDWNFAAAPPADFFVFPKPPGARSIGFLEALQADWQEPPVVIRHGARRRRD